ncbi:serine/threonine-protein kinase [Luteolibacter luteus]|uniref:Serine/threonine protein kinase n=1 Tax=Luteolibacter luteus TaxID=2728835 RepID=A0A858RM39_9BACT|nr:serine/threonine-protein kinase [Luteolibacter luteus]QJE98037.1 serine/threonine protein kinase [Luteolibacter luteus]
MNPSPLQRLFDEASELPPEEQDAYLEGATGDVGLRQRVSALLQSARRSPSFLGSPTLDASGNAVADPVQAGVGPGSKIGPYELIRKLGSGGGGVVFLARQEQPLQRVVSLKIARASLDEEEPRWRFEVERQAISRMEHSGIARVLDAGLTSEDRPWIAMEYIPGEAITTWCDSHQLNLTERAALMADVCDAVHHAHQKGVLHRDLKPSNVLVTKDHDGTPRACLIDFGIARLNDVNADARQTLPGRLPGTPAYMSPEQIQGEHDAVDARTDIFSLGVILYELLAGESPFRDPSGASREVTAPDRKTRLASEEAVVVRSRDRAQTPHGWKRAMRGDLSLIALKCLRIDPDERYASADALAVDLRAFVAHQPVSARRPTLAYLASRMVRRHPLATMSAILGVLVLVGSALAILDARRHAIAQRELALAERERAEDLFSGFARLIVAGNPEYGRSQDYLLKQAVLDFAERLPKELTRDPRTEAKARHTLAHALQGMGETVKAQEQFKVTLALLDELPEEKSSDLLPDVLFGNAISVAETQPDTAWGQLLRAEGLLKSSSQAYAPKMRARVLCQLSVMAHDRGDLPKAEAFAKQALEVAEEPRSGDPELVAKCLWTLSRVERSLERKDEVRRLQVRRLEVLVSVIGEQSPQVWDTKAELALLDLSGPDSTEATATLHEMARLTEAHFGAVHSQTLARWIDYARALARTGRKYEAKPVYADILKRASDPSFSEPNTLERWKAECRELEE